MTNTGVKLLSNQQGVLQSYFARADPWVCKYVLGKWTEPNVAGSALMLFGNQADARDFDPIPKEHIELWIVEYEPWPAKHLDFIPCGLAMTAQVIRFWEQAMTAEADYWSRLLMSTPVGTIFARRIKLLERVE